MGLWQFEDAFNEQSNGAGNVVFPGELTSAIMDSVYIRFSAFFFGYARVGRGAFWGNAIISIFYERGFDGSRSLCVPRQEPPL